MPVIEDQITALVLQLRFHAERRFRFVALPADGVAAAADVTLRDCLQAGPGGPGAADASGDRNDIGVT